MPTRSLFSPIDTNAWLGLVCMALANFLDSVRQLCCRQLEEYGVMGRRRECMCTGSWPVAQ